MTLPTMPLMVPPNPANTEIRNKVSKMFMWFYTSVSPRQLLLRRQFDCLVPFSG